MKATTSDAVKKYDGVWPEGARFLVTTAKDWGGSPGMIGHIEPHEDAHVLRPNAWMVLCTKEEFHEEVFRMAAQEVTDRAKARETVAAEWNGEGLPPVGWHGECTWGEKVSWHECVVCPGGRIARPVPTGSWVVKGSGSDYEFRPIKTQAQKDKEAGIADMLYINAIAPSEGMLSREEFCEALYDAGYRKQLTLKVTEA